VAVDGNLGLATAAAIVLKTFGALDSILAPTQAGSGGGKILSTVGLIPSAALGSGGGALQL